MEEYKCPNCKKLNYTSLTFGTVYCTYCGKKLILENGKCRLADTQTSLTKTLPYLRLVKKNNKS
ncbi:MAG TPA: hypothetical protein GXX38_03400 [Clostridia bacterium]|nr:hypothetical protein [Clostridia bacterium]